MNDALLQIVSCSSRAQMEAARDNVLRVAGGNGRSDERQADEASFQLVRAILDAVIGLAEPSQTLAQRAEALTERVESLAWYNGAKLTVEGLDRFEAAVDALEAVRL